MNIKTPVTIYTSDSVEVPFPTVAAQMDDTDKMAVSLYGKGTVAGDTAISTAPAVDGISYSTERGIAASGLVVRDVPNGVATWVRAADADSATSGDFLGAQTMLSNGASVDRARNNHEVTALASAARTASVNSADLVNYNARGIQLTVDLTILTATQTITVTIKGKSTLSGKYYTLLAGATLAAVGTTVMTIYPGVTVVGNLSASTPLPRIWRVEAVAFNAETYTMTVDANYIN